MSVIRRVLRKLVENMQRPGLLGIIGIRRRNACQSAVAAYFRLMLSKLPLDDLSKLAEGQNKEAAVHTARMRIERVLRIIQPVLTDVLKTHLLLAYQEGWKNTQVLPAKSLKEADTSVGGSPMDFLGPVGERAADFAATSAGQLIKSLDENTLEILEGVVSEAIEDKIGVEALAWRIRDEVQKMSLDRARMIATTEMNRAMSTASLEKLGVMGVQYKQWIPVDDPCPICEENEADGAIQVDDSFSSGDDAPPAHPNCRCAIAGARAPEGDE